VHGALELSGLGLRQLPATYFGWSIWSYLTNMTQLNLSNNMLQTLALMPVPTLLVKLDLSSNHLQELDESLSALGALRYAGLNQNKLTHLPACIKHWSKVAAFVNVLCAVQYHLGWRTLLKCNKTNHACLPALCG
jgi:Leucine-rich repeat (LRR) protein